MRRIAMGLLTIAFLLPAMAAQSDDGLSREGAGKKREAKDALEGKAPPKLQVTSWMNTKDGKGLKLGELRGQVVILDFWGTW